MRKRAEQVEDTRQRIIEAAVRLHTTVGPANTTVTALAEAAEVTRLTVYRHFPDEGPLFEACFGHWYTQHPGPDPDTWGQIPAGEERARHGLGELYAWYRRNGADLLPIQRDVEVIPAPTRQAMREADDRLADALVHGWPVRAGRRRLRAAAGHAVRFWTWYSLVVEQGLDEQDAVDLASALLRNAARN